MSKKNPSQAKITKVSKATPDPHLTLKKLSKTERLDDSMDRIEMLEDEVFELSSTIEELVNALMLQNDKLISLTEHANAVNAKFRAELEGNNPEGGTQEPEGNEWKHADDEPKEVESTEPTKMTFNYDKRSKGLSGFGDESGNN
jgi:predicted  nucleic acid-binding Zn-ribbon protein